MWYLGPPCTHLALGAHSHSNTQAWCRRMHQALAVPHSRGFLPIYTRVLGTMVMGVTQEQQAGWIVGAGCDGCIWGSQRFWGSHSGCFPAVRPMTQLPPPLCAEPAPAGPVWAAGQPGQWLGATPVRAGLGPAPSRGDAMQEEPAVPEDRGQVLPWQTRRVGGLRAAGRANTGR